MEYYEVVIVGGGIAGTGLAYNLKKRDFKGSMLIIDSKDIGAKSAYGYRNTFRDTIEKYGLPYSHIFKGLKFGDYNKIYLTIEEDFYFVNYGDACKSLFHNSKACFIKGTAKDIKNNVLISTAGDFKFKYLIDCSGSGFFLRKKFNLPLPFRYFCGFVRLLENKNRIEDPYFYYLEKEDGSNQDVYFLKDHILQGDWIFSNKITYAGIEKYSMDLFKDKLEKCRTLSEYSCCIPASPVPPLQFRNFAFLGDSFGNATPVAGEGMRPILESSAILSNAIIKNNLKLYEREWEKKYLGLYHKYLSTKLDMKRRFRMVKLLSDYPKLYKQGLKNEPVILPNAVKKKIPKPVLINVAYNLFKLKLGYQSRKLFYRA